MVTPDATPPVGNGAREANPLLDHFHAAWRAALLPIVVLGLWSALTDGGVVPKYVLPSPGLVVHAGWEFVAGGAAAEAYSGSFLKHFWASFQRVLAGFAIGSGIGIPLGVILGYHRGLARYIEPSLQLTRSIPGICWLPLALIWFGIGNQTSGVGSTAIWPPATSVPAESGS